MGKESLLGVAMVVGQPANSTTSRGHDPSRDGRLKAEEGGVEREERAKDLIEGT